MKHLTTGELLAVMNGAKSQPEHFAKCGVCVNRAVFIKEFQTECARTAAMGGTLFLPHVSGGDCPEGDEIAEYMEGFSSRPDFFQKHLRECDRCFEAASYYFAEATDMRGAVETAAPAKFRDAALDLQPRRNLKTTRQLRLPRWIAAPLPAYAAAALLWFAVSYGLAAPEVTVTGRTPHYTIYQKKADSLPLYYFGVTGKKVSVRPAKMRINATRREMSFSWEPVEGVKTYYFVLQEIRGSAPRIVRNVSTTESSITLRRELFLPSARYRWIVAAGLPPDRYFDGRLEFSVR